MRICHTVHNKLDIADTYHYHSLPHAITAQEYVCASLMSTLDQNASELLGAVNSFAAGNGALLLSLTRLDLAKLPTATDDELRLARGECTAAATANGSKQPKRVKSFLLDKLDAVEGDQVSSTA
jgi:hypothetical protein